VLRVTALSDSDFDGEGLDVGVSEREGDEMSSGVTEGAIDAVFDTFSLGSDVYDTESVLELALGDIVSVEETVEVML
jgi:hypothetical protein